MFFISKSLYSANICHFCEKKKPWMSGGVAKYNWLKFQNAPCT